MTRDEAVRTLQSMKSDFPLPKAAQTRRAQNDALDVAIEALKAEPCEDDFEESIHKMFDHIWDCEIDHPMFQDTVGELMTAVLQAYNKARPKPCDDTISRKAAIDALKEHRRLYCDDSPNTFSKLPYSEKCRVDELDTAIATLVNLPSAQPEVKKISYTDCANAMLMMLMDEVLTDGEYNRIMDKLNEHEKKG